MSKGCATENACQDTALQMGEVLLECCVEELCNVKVDIMWKGLITQKYRFNMLQQK